MLLGCVYISKKIAAGFEFVYLNLAILASPYAPKILNDNFISKNMNDLLNLNCSLRTLESFHVPTQQPLRQKGTAKRFENGQFNKVCYRSEYK